jgi:hypothetical protein
VFRSIYPGRSSTGWSKHTGCLGPGFSSKRHPIAMLYAQLAGVAALREVEVGLSSHAAGLYHLGMGGMVRSALADANRGRCPASE